MSKASIMALAAALSGSAAYSQEFRDACAFGQALGAGARHATFDALTHETVLNTQFAGVDFGGTARAWDAARFGGGGTFQTSPNVALNFGSAPIVMRFSPPVRGVGLFNTSIHDRERVQFFDGSGATLLDTTLAEGSVNFVGLLAPPGIARVEVVGIAPTNGTIFIDSVTYGDPTACYVDCDGGCVFSLDIFDFLCFQNRFDAGDPYACDCDTSTGPGVCDIFDFLCFQNAFDAGCP